MAAERPTTQALEACVASLLKGLGDDPERPGLRDTPARVVRALREMTAGMRETPASLLRWFDDPSDEMVVVRDVEFTSLCEHHLLPFSGVACVGYIPGGRVVGLSKIPRVVQCFARRLQLQERMTREIATTLAEGEGVKGAACVVRAHHTCMGCRGVRSKGTMVTSSMLGVFRSDASVRAEFLSLLR